MPELFESQPLPTGVRGQLMGEPPPPGLEFSIQVSYPEATAKALKSVPSHRLERAEFALRTVLPTKYHDTRQFQHQKEGLALMLHAAETGKKSFLLGDGMGLGKTAVMAALHVARKHGGWLGSSMAVHDTGGPGEWANYPQDGLEWITIDKAAAKDLSQHMVFIDEAQRIKNPASKRYRLMGKPVDFKVFASGTLVDKPEDFKEFQAQLGSSETMEQLIYDGVACMRSLAFPKVEVSVSASTLKMTGTEFSNYITAYKASAGKTTPANNDFMIQTVLEGLKIEQLLPDLVDRSLSEGRVPLIFVSRNEKTVHGCTTDELVRQVLASHAGIQVHSLDYKPANFDEQVSRDKQLGKPVYVCSIEAVGAGANLQDMGSGPRDLILLGLSFEVIDTLQVFSRVLRGNSRSTPRLVLPLLEVGFDMHRAGCNLFKLEHYPNSGPCIESLKHGLGHLTQPFRNRNMAVYAMVGYSPSLLDDDYFKEFAVTTGFMPTTKGNKMGFSVKNIPNWADHAGDIVKEVRERFPNWELDPADATWLRRPDSFIDRGIRYQAMREYAKIVYDRCVTGL